MASKSITDMQALLKFVQIARYPGAKYQWRLTADASHKMFLQLQIAFADGTIARGRKWRLSKWMTDGEVVQTAFKATMTALEHELRENFTYKGRAIYAPHYDLEALWAIAEQQTHRPEMVDVLTPSRLEALGYSSPQELEFII